MKDDEIWSLRYLFYNMMPSHYILQDEKNLYLVCIVLYFTYTLKGVFLRSEFVKPLQSGK